MRTQNMESLHINYEFCLSSKVRLENDKLEKVLLTKGDLVIEIFPPVGSDKDNLSTPQFIKVCISKGFDAVPDSLVEIAKEYSKLATNYFVRTLDLIRLHTRQFLLGNSKLNGIEQYSVSINNNRGDKLYRRDTVAVAIRSIDINEFSLNRVSWSKVYEYLVGDKEAELYLLLLLDAKYLAFARRHREAIIIITSAIEQFTIEYLDHDKYEHAKHSKEIAHMEFSEFFTKAVSEARGKSIKTERKDDYHRLKYLFAARNNITHGKGCWFRVGNGEINLVKRITVALEIDCNGKIWIDTKMCLAFADYMFAFIDWIKAD